MVKLSYRTPDSHKEYTSMNSLEVEIETEATLSEMLDSYLMFLRAVGYNIPADSYIQIVKDDDEYDE